jgi:hypothetical protein
MTSFPFPEGIIQNPFSNASVSKNPLVHRAPHSAKSSSMLARNPDEKLGATSMFCKL